MCFGVLQHEESRLSGSGTSSRKRGKPLPQLDFRLFTLCMQHAHTRYYLGSVAAGNEVQQSCAGLL